MGCSGLAAGKPLKTTEEKKDWLWRQLSSTIGKKNSVLLFHLTNHYQLIFAWREYLIDEYEPVAVAASSSNPPDNEYNGS